MTKPRTLYEKIWDDHVVRTEDDGTDLLFIDLHLVHEVELAGLRPHDPQHFLRVQRTLSELVTRVNELATLNAQACARGHRVLADVLDLGGDPQRDRAALAAVPDECVVVPLPGILQLLGHERRRALAGDAQQLLRGKQVPGRHLQVVPHVLGVGGHDHEAAVLVLALGGPGQADLGGRHPQLRSW